MIQALHTAASGLRNQQLRIDTAANNLANVNTTGYKSRSLSFQDTIYTAMKSPEGEREKQIRGAGLLPGTTRTDLSPGAVKETGGDMDFAIAGAGYFCIEEPDGALSYTRNGSFSISMETDGSYLVNDRGLYVLDADGSRIQLSEEGSSNVEIGADGTVTRADGSTSRIGVFVFDNPSGLSSEDNTTIRETVNSGTATLFEEVELRQSYLEASNVDLATELTQLIQAQRMFSLAGRALQTADDMEGLAINVRR